MSACKMAKQMTKEHLDSIYCKKNYTLKKIPSKKKSPANTIPQKILSKEKLALRK
jgi:hypothetical protein